MTGRSTGGTGDRRLKQHVRTAKSRSAASTQWLQRQLNDPYVARAKAEGYRSRAAFKLIEINARHRFLRPGATVVDLGAAPGGWSQVAAHEVGRPAGRGAVLAIDILPMDPIPGVEMLERDFTAPEAPHALRERLGDAIGHGGVDVVLSDMAANTVGHKRTDHLRIIHLAELAAEFAREVLRPGGTFLTKLFQGGETAAFVTALKRDFASVRHVKPDASRSDSSELYVLATGYRPSIHRGSDAPVGG